MNTAQFRIRCAIFSLSRFPTARSKNRDQSKRVTSCILKISSREYICIYNYLVPAFECSSMNRGHSCRRWHPSRQQKEFHLEDERDATMRRRGTKNNQSEIASVGFYSSYFLGPILESSLICCLMLAYLDVWFDFQVDWWLVSAVEAVVLNLREEGAERSRVAAASRTEPAELVGRIETPEHFNYCALFFHGKHRHKMTKSEKSESNRIDRHRKSITIFKLQVHSIASEWIFCLQYRQKMSSGCVRAEVETDGNRDRVRIVIQLGERVV